MAIQKTSSMLERLGGSTQLLTQITNVFLQNWRREYGNLQAALKSGDRTLLTRSLRSLRASLGYFADESLLTVFEQLEKAAVRDESSATLQLAEKFEPKLLGLVEELQELKVSLERQVA